MALGLFAQENSQPSAPEFSFSGSVDAYFRTNFNHDFTDAPATSFANLPGFALGMVNLVGAYDATNFGVKADLVVGPRGEDAVFLSPLLRPGGTSSIVNQLYVYLKASDKVTFTLGNFNTFLGYEVISPVSNFNYSTSYMFSYGPFSHTGLKMDLDLGGGLSMMVGVFNPTDATEYNPTNNYVGGAQMGYSFDKGSVYVNSLFSDGFFQIDLTTGMNITEKIYLGLNATSASDNFSGVAGYLQTTVNDKLTLGVRTEYFKDNGVGAIATGENVLNFTVSGNYTVGNIKLIPEIRLDKLSYSGFGEGPEADATLSSFILAAVYGF